jgi:hypothetical protein
MALQLLPLLAALTCCACSSEKSGQDATATGKKPSFFQDQTTSIDARVDAIDPAARTMTLRGPAGGTLSFVVDNQVKNLDKVKVGDRVRADFYESVAIEVRRPRAADADGSAATASGAMAATQPAVAATQRTMAATQPGAKPAGVMAARATLTATVENIDRKKPAVTLRGPAGNARTFKVRDRKNLKGVEVGDEVVLTYTEALAVAVKELRK